MTVKKGTVCFFTASAQLSSSCQLTSDLVLARFPHVHRDLSEQVKLVDLHHGVLQRPDPVLVHGLSGVSVLVKPLRIVLVPFVSLVSDHPKLSDVAARSGDVHSFKLHPVVDVVVLSSPAPVVVGEAVDLQVLFFPNRESGSKICSIK